MAFKNVYEDAQRAEAYAKLEFPGTYYLAYRDLPEIITRYVQGKKVIDFGCGTGRSTRFLRQLGFDVIGVDISGDMIGKAREADPKGDYRLIVDGELGRFQEKAFDLVLSVFTFDNIPTMEKKIGLFKDLRNVLTDDGCIINLVSSPEIYINEWASFTTKDYPENKKARSGDRVKIIITAVEDARPVEDILWTDKEYQKVYGQAGLITVQTLKPLARESEPHQWVSETRIAPWVIYVLKKDDKQR
jgi:SAM-dependent methyltransferase